MKKLLILCPYVDATCPLAHRIWLLFTFTTCMAGFEYFFFISIIFKGYTYCLTASIILVYILFSVSRFSDSCRSCLSISPMVVI